LPHFGLEYPLPARWQFVAMLSLTLGSVLAASPARSQAQDATPRAPSITVNIFNERHRISPYVYGSNWPDINPGSDFIPETGTRLSRWGGNSITSYNWKLRIRNSAADWFFENYPDQDSIQWVKKIEQEGSDAIVGIAMVDWTPKASGLHSYSVKKYGPQQKTAPDDPDAGNGIRPDGTQIRENDPNDAYVPLRDRPAPGDPPGTIYRAPWIKQLKAAFGSHPHLYEFDNEPEIWDGTHRDIHPKPVTYDEMRDKYLDFANLIQSIDPKAILTGPTVSSWWFMWNSAAGPADKTAHGGMDYLPWWLGAIADADRHARKQRLDVFDIHAYPDYNSSGPPAVVDGSMLRAPRGWWDPTFISEGGIGTTNNATATQPDMHAPAIIPRFRAMVNAIYPSAKLGITEWGFFQDDNEVASLADADVYGIFGRENLYLATRFTAPKPGSVCSLALEMYQHFAPISVQDTTNLNVDLFTSYAALSEDGRRLTIMTINKDPKKSVTAQITLNGFTPTRGTAYARSGDGKSITVSPVTAELACYTFPPYSQTLLVFEGKTTPGAVDWEIKRDALMMITGHQGTLQVLTTQKHESLRLTSIAAQSGVTLTIRSAVVSAGHAGVIDVAAGAKSGFYRYTLRGKTTSGCVETQSGWIVVGIPRSMPQVSGK
jgi:hypothetical protein